MPPRKGPRNVVRSGNAGNSSKASTKEAPPVQLGPDGLPRPPPLFPAGYKSPITQLNEKCQKQGWERPNVDARKTANGWTGSCTIKKRVSKNIYDLDSVRFSCDINGIDIESAALAKHYVATYALFRFNSQLPMAMGLPPVIRPYWSTLQAEKAAAPEHRAWEYATDPFAARKEVDDRQAKRKEKDAAKAAVAENGASGSSTPHDGQSRNASGRSTPSAEVTGGKGYEWARAPEVKMSTTLREMVEDTVKKMMQEYPDAVLQSGSNGSSTPIPLDSAAIITQLTALAFRPAHIRSCMTAVQAAHARMMSNSSATNDPLVLALSILSPLEAAIEWLLLHLPEDDMPPRYRPSSASSDFVTGASAKLGGQAGLVKGWVMDKLVKQAGFPRKVVEQVLQDDARLGAALDSLGRRLCGWEAQAVVDLSVEEVAERDQAREEELLALEAVLDDRFSKLTDTEYAIRIEDVKDTIELRLVFDSASPYPSAAQPTPPAFYIASDSVPSYMRLHLHRALLEQFRQDDRHDLRGILEGGAGGAVLVMLEHLETALPGVIETPPDVGQVTEHLAPKPAQAPPADRVQQQRRTMRKRNGPFKRSPPTLAEHEELKRRQELLLRRKDYEEMMAVRRSLPAWKERDNIVGALEKDRVLVVVGETGCGKSTQLPQFILDHEIQNLRGASTNILVTQPRRVAAMGVASRVAQERMEDVDDAGTVGYAIRGEQRRSKDTRLMFCTTGVLLRRMGSGDPDLEGVSHVVVDEAHERGVDTDLLICLLRDLLERNKTIKVVLMSATINEQIFIKYFNGCPSLTIPGFTHPVTDHYLEDVMPHINYQPQPQRFGPRQTEDQKASIRADFAKLNLDAASTSALEILAASDRIDYGLVAAVVKHIVATADTPDGAILIFMPGVMEIRQCVTELQAASIGSVVILPLHANLSSAEQRRVFLPTKPRRKIVVATNVAETSVTIPDVVYVVDGGKVKETQYDADSGLQRLVETWTSRASAKQRRGRAGRTQPGQSTLWAKEVDEQCYKLYTRRTENNSMPRFPIPEILRTPLEQLFLQVKAMDEDLDVMAFLRKAIDPPKMEAMDLAWQTLLDLGIVEGEDQKSRLTALGRHISMIPVDIRLAKMLVLGALFKCLDPVVTIAAILSSKPLFTSPIDKREEACKARESFARARSDLLTDVAAFDACNAIKQKGAMRQFCDQNFISQSALRDITGLRQDFFNALSSLGFIASPKALQSVNVNSSNHNLVKAIIVGGLYPRVARIALPTAQFERLQQGTIQKDHHAKEVKFFDQNGRVFLHPTSILFAEAGGLKSGFVTYFAKAETSKVFLRDATEVPLFALLLFGGPITVQHFAGGVMLGKDGFIKLRANTRIAVLCSQLRRLLDAQLAERIESPDAVDLQGHDEVVGAMLALLSKDGLSL